MDSMSSFSFTGPIIYPSLDRMQALFDPKMSRAFPYPVRVDQQRASQVLAENVNRLMSQRPGLDSNPKLSRASGVPTSTISRVRNGSVEATLQVIERLAYAFKLEPWQLLTDYARPLPPEQMALTPEALSIARWFDRLTDSRDRAVAETQAMGAILRLLQQRDLPPSSALDQDSGPQIPPGHTPSPGPTAQPTSEPSHSGRRVRPKPPER
jgi:transcriptional regulator with XRE-family HTH domain